MPTYKHADLPSALRPYTLPGADLSQLPPELVRKIKSHTFGTEMRNVFSTAKKFPEASPAMSELRAGLRGIGSINASSTPTALPDIGERLKALKDKKFQDFFANQARSVPPGPSSDFPYLPLLGALGLGGAGIAATMAYKKRKQQQQQATEAPKEEQKAASFRRKMADAKVIPFPGKFRPPPSSIPSAFPSMPPISPEMRDLIGRSLGDMRPPKMPSFHAPPFEMPPIDMPNIPRSSGFKWGPALGKAAIGTAGIAGMALYLRHLQDKERERNYNYAQARAQENAAPAEFKGASMMPMGQRMAPRDTLGTILRGPQPAAMPHDTLGSIGNPAHPQNIEHANWLQRLQMMFQGPGPIAGPGHGHGTPHPMMGHF